VQARQTTQLVPVRFVTLAFAFLAAFLLASAMGYVVRGWSLPAVVTPAPIVWVAPTPMPSHPNENRLPGQGDVTPDKPFGVGR